MITANLAGSSLQPSHLRGEREKFKSHSRLNLNEDNSDSASNKQNPEDWNPNDTNSDHDAEKLSEVCMHKCSRCKTWLTLGCMGIVIIGTVVLIILVATGAVTTHR